MSLPELTTYTSKDLAALKIEQFESITEQCQFRYQLTEGELGWLDWIGRRYSIAEYIADNIDYETGLVTIDTWDLGRALSADGVDRAPCLAEDTQLQRLIWYIGPNEGED